MEIIHYDPRTEEKQLMDFDRSINWKISKFATLKCDVVRLLQKLGVW
jgi:hypothetical protein